MVLWLHHIANHECISAFEIHHLQTEYMTLNYFYYCGVFATLTFYMCCPLCSLWSISKPQVSMLAAHTSVSTCCILLTTCTFEFSNGSVYMFNVFSLEIASAKILCLPFMCMNLML